MDKTVERYFQLKREQREIELELAELRPLIMGHLAELGVTDTEIGAYRVRVIALDRKEYDDDKLYKALPDSEVWRLLSKADPSKIAGLVKLNVISEDVLQGTFTMKKVSSLQVERK